MKTPTSSISTAGPTVAPVTAKPATSGARVREAGVALNFDRGAARYDKLATIQQKVALDLFERIKPWANKAASIVDLGCGTGQLLALCGELNSTCNSLGVDVSSSMLAQAQMRNPNAGVLLASLENTGLEDESSDLLLSSSAFQWVDIAAAFAESARILQPGGHLAVSCFGRGTISEWRSLWNLNGCFMPTLTRLELHAARADLSIIESSTRQMTAKFDSFNDALASIRGLGAGSDQGRPRGAISRRVFRQAKADFQKRVAKDGCFNMRYSVHTLIARKPPKKSQQHD